MRSTKRAPRGALVILAMLVASLAIAACGGSSNSGKTTTSKNTASTSTTKSASASRSAFTTCLKQHGVTVPAGRQGGFGFRRNGTSTTGAPPAGGTTTTGARPAGGFAGGGGGGFGNGGGFAGGNSKFGKAFQACRSKLGSSGFGEGRFGAGGPGGRHFTPQFSATALKSYVSCIRKNGYPSMPEPDTTKGAKFVFPASVEKNAEFQAANKKCQSILRQGFGRPAAGQGTTTTSTTTSNA